MNAEKLNSWLGVIANIGVLVGVIFLVVEVRQTTNAVRTNNVQSSLALGFESGSWLLDPEFAHAWLAGLEDTSTLTDVQRLQFDEFLGQRLNIWEFAVNANESGTMSEADWASWDGYFSSWIRQGELRNYWRSTKRADYAGAGDFLIYVDSVVADD